MLDQKTLREKLHYDPATGEFVNRNTRWEVCGGVAAQGYRIIGELGGRYRAHRLAWLYAHGKWPDGILSHVNYIFDDSLIANLGLITQRLNKRSRLKVSGNTSGFTGVAKYETKKHGTRWFY